jgi:hypothetical protein
VGKTTVQHCGVWQVSLTTLKLMRHLDVDLKGGEQGGMLYEPIERWPRGRGSLAPALIFPNCWVTRLFSWSPFSSHSRFPTPMMDLSKHIECISKWPAHIAPGLPTFGALFLLATGGLVIACKVWTFVRVLLSLFVLPGKPV